ncbi:MAG TPA: diguanylate cyclase [Casimicrobiaceae bacterium]|nr:diguanylate cyclase [Casimicrobiaceae bacterium]HXU67077.1 diguanylate cyclase [Casimicrobiaceae bacterium]
MPTSRVRSAAGDAESSSPELAFSPDETGRDRGLRFVRRVHRLRTLGLGLGFLCVASVLWVHGAPWYLWTLLVANGLAWPHLARWLAIRSAHPVRAELRHLAIDSTMGGVWIALMQFNLLPSILLVTMLSVDKVAVHGPRFLFRTTICLLAACVATSAMLGFRIDVATPMPVIVACIPFLVAYPLAIATVMHRLGRRITDQNRWLAKVSSTDELTGLANRRQGLRAAAQALARYRRHGGSAVLMIADIDRFKEINDRHGHPAGDRVLRQVASVLLENMRATDTAARYAGDEFLLVLPDTNLEGAAEMAKRIRARFSEALAQMPDAKASVSLGAAEVYEDMADVEDWVQQADTALYRAKEAGRDRFVAAPRIEVGTRDEAGESRYAS